MRFQIPQDVQREDTIIGPVTFAQLAMMLIGGRLTYVIYLALAAQGLSVFVWAPVVTMFAVLTLVVTFVKIFDMKFHHFFLYFLEHFRKPKSRRWFKEKDEFYFSVFQRSPSLEGKSIAAPKKEQPKRKNLEEISKQLDL